jgi:uncharacterized protein with HEPN domain
MNPRAANRLRDALDAARLARRFLDSMSLEAYSSDLLVQSAVERRLEIVGEALNAALRDAPELADAIPRIRRWVGMRNILIHAYPDINPELVWATVVQDVPALIAVLERILNEREGEPR